MKPALAITGTICAAIATAAAISAFSVRTHLADSQKAPGTGKGALFLPPEAGSARAVVSLKHGLLTIAAEKVKLVGSRKIQAIEVMREPAARPGSPQPAGNAETGGTTQSEAARTKALFLGQTGGDEGVWDDVDVGTLLNPVASSPVATESSPAQAVPASSSIATSSQE
jgi:hypothetical protein